MKIFQKIFTFIKNKKADAVEAIIIVPIWVMLLAYIGNKIAVFQHKQYVADAGQAIARIIALSDSPDTAIIRANDYLEKRKETYDEFDADSILSVNYLDDDKLIPSTNFNKDWVNGTFVTYKIKIKTPLSGSALNFCPPILQTIDLKDEEERCFSVFGNWVEVSYTTVLSNGRIKDE